MALLAFASQAQRWEWVKGYGTQASNGFEIIGTVTDNEDNLYFLGEFHTDAHWDGEPLLPSELYPGISGPHVIIAKISPTGDMVWKKVIASGGSCSAFDIKKVGDSAFACMIDFTGPNLLYKLCWLDTLLVGDGDYPQQREIPSMPMTVFDGSRPTAYLKFGFDGTLQEQHFLHLTYVDNYGRDIIHENVTGDYSYIYTGVLYFPRFDIDRTGNIYILSQPDGLVHLGPGNEYSVADGQIQTVKVWVDNRMVGTIDTRHRPKAWYPHMMKFSPHFDTLLADRYIIQDYINGRADNDLKISLGLDRNCNIYVTLSLQPIFDSICLETIIFDSLQRLTANIDLYDINIGYLIVYDSVLNTKRVLHLDDGFDERHCYTEFRPVSFDYDSNIVFFSGEYANYRGCEGNVPLILRGLDRDTTLYNIYNDCFVLKFDLDTWEFKGMLKPQACMCELGGYGRRDYNNIVTKDNRVFMQIIHSGALTLPSGTFRGADDYVQSSAVVIFDYAGNVIGGDHSRQFGFERRNGPLALVDSVLYVVQITNNPATFGDYTVHPNGKWYSFVAKYVDTSFMSVQPYTPPAPPTPPEAVQTTVESGTLTLYPNPTTGEMRLKAAEGRVLAASIVSASGVRQPTAVDGDRIDVSRLSAGIYFVTVTTDTGIYTVKFVKQ